MRRLAGPPAARAARDADGLVGGEALLGLSVARGGLDPSSRAGPGGAPPVTGLLRAQLVHAKPALGRCTGTVAVTEVGVLVVNVAVTPLNLTDVTPVRFVPVIVTDVPTAPLVGVKLVIVGGAATVNVVALVTVPPSVVTAIGPVVAPAGTAATICVAELTT